MAGNLFFNVFAEFPFSAERGGGEMQLAMIMVCSFILFVTAVLLLIHEFCRLVSMEKHIGAFFCFLLLYSLLGFKAWTEIFYWFSGAVSYSLPLSSAMLAVTFYLQNKNKICFTAACVLVFLASGGSLEVAGTSCFGILIILCIKGCRNLQRKDYIFFGMAVLGALINTAAPGNFMRRNVVDASGLHISAAFIHSVSQAVTSFEWLFFKTPFCMVIVLCVSAGVYTGGGRWYCRMLFYKVIIMCAVMPVVTCFPVYLAYSTENGSVYFPNRCEFVCIFVIVFESMVSAIVSGIALREAGYLEKKREAAVLAALLCLLMPVWNEGCRYSNSVIYRMYNNEAIGNFKKYHNSVMDIYRMIEKSECGDVVIENIPAAVSDFYNINDAMSTDSQDWRNQAIAQYYGKNSIALKQDE